jgi:signal transduction histidine kinase
MSEEHLPCSTEELRSLFLFESLTDEQLDFLFQHGHVVQLPAGPVYTEGESATCFYVLIEGGVAMYRRVGSDDVETNRTDFRGVYGGATQAFVQTDGPQVYSNSMRATVPSRFFVLDAEEFGKAMRQWFPMAVHLLEGLFIGIVRSQQMVGQRERLLALGSLSAGLTHELNNPAAAAVRATSALRERVAGMRHKLGFLASGNFAPQTIEQIIKIQDEAVERAAKAAKGPQLSALQTGDREDELTDWLDDHGVGSSWDVAPTFVQGGLDITWLQDVLDTVGGDAFPSAVRWLGYTIETEQLMDEIADASTRISTLVSAAKQYSQMDRAPFQVVDVRELLDSTLVMLGRKIGDGIEVVKDYDPDLPQIPCYAAELNQVWTNLIDNAVSAMAGSGTLTIRTRRQEDTALIDIQDTGPGVPAEIKDRIFEPFFTTKPVGEGTGLGLDISWRIVVRKHHGDIGLESEPGRTVFRVQLPLNVPAPTDG